MEGDEKAMTKPAEKVIELCKADPIGPGPNYNKPHVPVQGEYNGEPRLQCLCCGRWLEESSK